MNKWFKLIPISLLVLIASFYLLNFMPIVNSNCGCINSNSFEKRVSLNYFVGCFCTGAEVQPDDFPMFMKSELFQFILIIIPVILAIFSLIMLRKRIN